MIYLQTEALTKSYGDRLLFGDISFSVNGGDKIGIVAKNGTGKTTLLRILAGKESADSGRVICRNDLRVIMLEQEPQFAADATVATAINDDSDFVGHPDRRQHFERLCTQMGLTEAAERSISDISGGQRKRLALARAIAAEPDLLILDEPTNHLDIKTIEWLEGYLKRSRMTLLMVTHDRYFLDRVCNTIIEMHRTEIFIHRGNFDYYLRRRAERLEAMSAELAKVRNTLRREQDWMSRQPQARATKAKGRIDRFYDLKERSRTNLNEDNLSLQKTDTYIGKKIFVAHGISKSYGDQTLIKDFDYNFARYDKLGIVGANGVGKSTFVKMLQGLVEPDSGYFEIGETVRFGYYSQEGIAFKKDDKVIDAVSRIADEIERADGVKVSAMQWLQQFLFSVPDQQKYIHTLSGGELCRLHLATVLMRQPNFLVLDEPTNDLDLVTLGVLEEFLVNFKGCCIIISHDRYFLDNIVDHIFVMEGNGRIKDFPGNYSDYRAFMDKHNDQTAEATKSQEQAAKTKPRTERVAKLTFKERREFEALEAEIEQLTAERKELEQLFNSGTHIDNVADKAARYQELADLLDEKEMRWLELSEKA